MTKYNERHGGPYDRGSADAWYHRAPDPHYFVAGTMTSDRVEAPDMTAAEKKAYWAGYNDTYDPAGGKDYG